MPKYFKSYFSTNPPNVNTLYSRIHSFKSNNCQLQRKVSKKPKKKTLVFKLVHYKHLVVVLGTLLVTETSLNFAVSLVTEMFLSFFEVQRCWKKKQENFLKSRPTSFLPIPKKVNRVSFLALHQHCKCYFSSRPL